jgi:hypothetical protein
MGSILNFNDFVVADPYFNFNNKQYKLNLTLASIMRYVEWGKAAKAEMFEGESLKSLLKIIVCDQSFITEFEKESLTTQSRIINALISL